MDNKIEFNETKVDKPDLSAMMDQIISGKPASLDLPIKSEHSLSIGHNYSKDSILSSLYMHFENYAAQSDASFVEKSLDDAPIMHTSQA